MTTRRPARPLAPGRQGTNRVARLGKGNALRDAEPAGRRVESGNYYVHGIFGAGVETDLLVKRYDSRRLDHGVFPDGDVYRYFDVPRFVFLQFIRAESMGAFFNERIRDRYPTEGPL